MALMPSQDVINVLKNLGMKWPQANEDELREAAAHYGKAAREFEELQEQFILVARRISEEFSGEAADAFLWRVNTICSGDESFLSAGAAQADKLAENANNTATDVEHTKWSIIAQAVALIAQLAITAFLGFFFGPAAMFGMSFEYALVREFIKNLLIALLRSIAMQTAIGAGVGAAMDAIVQKVQIDQGHRSGIDTKLLSQATVAGAIGGAIAAPFDLIGLGFGKWIGNRLGISVKGAVTADLTKLFTGDAGRVLGKDLGAGVGKDVGAGVGAGVGKDVGAGVGAGVGKDVGAGVGAGVGKDVGA
ncbi:hypothetical protein ABTZ57_27765, partial [Streptomyces sp. NPDC094048]|uniref:WXG100-like domain-containing protein n=1 Tax=Streptomyces sp. NPDC094048 TaxID=3155207 RepID=UPI00331869AD